MTIPKHHSVFLSTQPLSSIFSLSRGYLLSLQYKVPVNLSSLLFGGSQMTSPEEQSTGSLTNMSHRCGKGKFIDVYTTKCNHSEECQNMSTCPRAESRRCPPLLCHTNVKIKQTRQASSLTVKVHQFCNISQI